MDNHALLRAGGQADAASEINPSGSVAAVLCITALFQPFIISS